MPSYQNYRCAVVTLFRGPSVCAVSCTRCALGCLIEQKRGRLITACNSTCQYRLFLHASCVPPPGFSVTSVALTSAGAVGQAAWQTIVAVTDKISQGYADVLQKRSTPTHSHAASSVRRVDKKKNSSWRVYSMCLPVMASAKSRRREIMAA